MVTLDDFGRLSHFLPDHVSRWARERPDDVALVDADDGIFVTWREFDTAVKIRALELLHMGFQVGDVMVTLLPLLPEHVYLEYAAFTIGMIVCPLDVRLKEREVVRCIKALKPARRLLYVSPDDTDSEDKWGRKKRYEFGQIARAVRRETPWVTDYLILGPQEDADWDATGILNLLKRARARWRSLLSSEAAMAGAMASLEARRREIDPARDGAMLIFTTGSTGYPKPAVLPGAGIVCQNACMVEGFGIRQDDRLLLNLPMSHVAAQTVALMSFIFAGGMIVLLHGFRADKSLEAIQRYKVTLFGQVPALFAMEWNLPNFHEYDLSSVRVALYGAQGMSRPQLEKFSQLAPVMATGLGMTEACGFVSYQVGGKDDIDAFVSGLGHDFPVTPVTVRAPMLENGRAGLELSPGEIGEICVGGPQVFLGYYGMDEETRKTISTDGILYTGDMGFKDAAGLHLAGRRKFIIKPKGFQVYPPEVENHLEQFPGVAVAGVIGVPHEIFSEGVVAFIEVDESKAGKQVDARKLAAHSQALAAYARPSLYIFTRDVAAFEDGKMPLNRTEKTDYQVLKKAVGPFIEAERAAGRWDAGKA